MLSIRSIARGTLLSLLAVGTVSAAPVYDQGRKEVERVLDDLIRWLPGAFDSFPQIHYERTVRMPAGGEHEYWHRTFALIDAPQVGAHVFYGQVNVGGRDGPILPRSQVLYVASIDEARGVVLIKGQTLADAEKYVNLQDHPELWREVRQRDPKSIRCDFIWHRHADQIVGVLDSTEEGGRINGPGTCSYTAASGQPFVADAEWVLSPESLWLFDTNKLAGAQFIGRLDQTHTRLSRARPYACHVTDVAGTRKLDAHDRGYTTSVGSARAPLTLLLLRSDYPARDGFGLDDELRLTLADKDGKVVGNATAPPASERIALQHAGVDVRCDLQPAFGPMPATSKLP